MSINGIEWILIIAVALILFGPKKLPELGKAVGKSLREFKRATNGLLNDNEPSKEKESKESKSVQEETKASGLSNNEPLKETTAKESKAVPDEAKTSGLNDTEPPKETASKEKKAVQEEAKQPNL